jgi:cobalt transporter subunit CbtB
MQASNTIAKTEPVTGAITARWPAIATLLMGVVMLYFVGFSPFSQAHNAAHDTRHANGFPCH